MKKKNNKILQLHAPKSLTEKILLILQEGNNQIIKEDNLELCITNANFYGIRIKVPYLKILCSIGVKKFLRTYLKTKEKNSGQI